MMTTESLVTEFHDIGITNYFGDESFEILISGGGVGREWTHSYAFRLPFPLTQRLQESLEPLAFSITDDYARHKFAIKCAATLSGLRLWSRTGEKLTIRAKSSHLKITVDTIQRSNKRNG